MKVTLKYLFFQGHPSGEDTRLPQPLRQALLMVIALGVFVLWVFVTILALAALALAGSDAEEAKPLLHAMTFLCFLELPLAAALAYAWRTLCRLQPLQGVPPEVTHLP